MPETERPLPGLPPADVLPDFRDPRLLTRTLKEAAATLRQGLANHPQDPAWAEAIWRLKMECLRNSYDLGTSLPPVRPEARELAASLGCLEALEEAGIVVLQADELRALEDAWLDVAWRSAPETPSEERAEPAYPLRFRLVMESQDEAWRPVEVLYERRYLSARKAHGFLRTTGVGRPLEELEIQDLPAHPDHVLRLGPLREAPPGTDPEDLLRGDRGRP